MIRVKILLVSALLLFQISSANAQKIGQYQVVSLDRGDALILDTTNGNVWHWLQLPAPGSEKKTTEVLRYQGQAQPQMSFVDGKPVPLAQ
jgi:hypothetical protein